MNHLKRNATFSESNIARLMGRGYNLANIRHQGSNPS